jgi:tetraacyldisaccharide 4'-kinase
MNRFRILIFAPFSLIYAIILRIRNVLFDRKILKSHSFPFPLICVGNLSTGGTGKTPHCEYLIRLLSEQGFVPAYLSRGYRRKSKGFVLAEKTLKPADIGDEAFQIHMKFPDMPLAVSENRKEGIRKMLNLFDDIDVLILDDAFQHRRIHAGLNILLSTFEKPFFKDFILPSGNLRDNRSSAKRADLIVFTKSPVSLSEYQKSIFRKKVRDSLKKELFFSYIQYLHICNMHYEPVDFHIQEFDILLFTGIANPVPLHNHLRQNAKSIRLLRFPDHYEYQEKDTDKIIRVFQNMDSARKIILTTEKDISRIKMSSIEARFNTLDVYFISLKVCFDSDQKVNFDTKILNYVRKNQRKC